MNFYETQNLLTFTIIFIVILAPITTNALITENIFSKEPFLKVDLDEILKDSEYKEVIGKVISVYLDEEREVFYMRETRSDEFELQYWVSDFKCISIFKQLEGRVLDLNETDQYSIITNFSNCASKAIEDNLILQKIEQVEGSDYLKWIGGMIFGAGITTFYFIISNRKKK